MNLPIEISSTITFINTTTHEVKCVDRGNKKLDEINELIKNIHKANLYPKIGENIDDLVNEIVYTIHKITYTSKYNKCHITYHCIDSCNYKLLLDYNNKPRKVKPSPKW